MSFIPKNTVPGTYSADAFLFKKNGFRKLKSREISTLIQNQNLAMDWQRVFIKDSLDISLIQKCEFWGTVYLDEITPGYLEYEQISLPTGLYNSVIASSFIGKNISIRNVGLLANYLIQDNCYLFNINQITAAAGGSFGTGFLAEGKPEDERFWIEVGNENGGRKILTYPEMLPADAYLWYQYPDDSDLIEKLISITDKSADKHFYHFAEIGAHTVIQNCSIIKNVRIGGYCTIQGANKLENLTIQSSLEEPTFIGPGVHLTSGVVGFQNKIDSNVIAENFFTGRNVQLKYGTRFINTFLGANSTISCCEVLNNLIFPFHEQHHNNSFLIASAIMGQSNIAAGATIGSNHNSRAADGEILAERGFWPGLTANFKHNSKFAAFTLIANGSYPSELNIRFPFSLISPAKNGTNIQLFPGFWFKYNMYALARNAWKFRIRDKRKIKAQYIETNFLAPDTIEEMNNGIHILKQAIEKELKQKFTIDEIVKNYVQLDKEISLSLDGFVNKSKAEILKPAQGIYLYRMMIVFFSMREILLALRQLDMKDISMSFESILESYNSPPQKWMNLGGQIVAEQDVDQLIYEIKQQRLLSWERVHQKYDKLQKQYEHHKKNIALFHLIQLNNITINDFKHEHLKNYLTDFIRISEQLINWAFESRRKDYSGEFRLMNYRNEHQAQAVLGIIEENPFLNEYKIQMQEYTDLADKIRAQLD